VGVFWAFNAGINCVCLEGGYLGDIIMWEISIWFFAFLFTINGFLVWFASADIADYELISPFTNQTYTPPALPNINSTLGNVTAHQATNSTSFGAGLITIWETGAFAWNASIFFIDFLVGSVTGSFLTTMGMPAEFLTILYGTEVVFVIITVLHFWRGIF
jgi:hypothetical protein